MCVVGRATVSTQVIDDGDRTITYYAPPNGNWTIENVYTQAISADGSTTFHDSYWTDATATIAFQGTPYRWALVMLNLTNVQETV